MTSIAENRENDQREISATLAKFYADYGVAGLLRACRGKSRRASPRSGSSSTCCVWCSATGACTLIFRSTVNKIQRITRLFTEEDLYRSETRTLFLNRKEIAYEKTGQYHPVTGSLWKFPLLGCGRTSRRRHRHAGGRAEHALAASVFRNERFCICGRRF